MTNTVPHNYVNNNQRKMKLSPREQAILMHVWSLTENERALLDQYFVLKATGHQILQAIMPDNTHIGHRSWKLFPMPFSSAEALLEPAQLYLISVRVNLNSNLTWALFKRYEGTDRDKQMLKIAYSLAPQV
jgi:hypothetical protein